MSDFTILVNGIADVPPLVWLSFLAVFCAGAWFGASMAEGR
jgi:hypothetical protein